MKEVCNECLKKALGNLELLQKSVCLKEEHKGRDFPDSFLWCLPRKGGVISICRPISIYADEMRRRGFDFVMQHTFLNCFYGVIDCRRPHTKVEEDVWNKWNKSGETRMKLHNKGKIFYIELSECIYESLCLIYVQNYIHSTTIYIVHVQRFWKKN